MKKLIQNKSILIILSFVFLWGCSTKKNTFVTRNFHELTSHYNVYFNGNEAYTTALENALKEIGDDYTKILPIYIENQPQVQKKVSGDMDYAVEKATKLIKYHSITVPPENKKKKKKNRQSAKSEYNKWIDDAYILMGKAYLAKGDFIHANGTFSTILRKFKDDPVKYDAYVWLIRTLTQSERYSEARSIIETLEGDDSFPAELEGELAIAAADLALKQEKYEDAIQYLNIGINNIKGNKKITRYTYILAQLYQETGKKGQALDAYNEVIRRRPNYEMRFNAQINGASVYSGEGSGSALRKELLKMTRKVRNKDFLDQIYFALGNLSFGEDKLPEAISYYKLSAVNAEKNVYQRTLSCLTLAEIYFEQKKYVPSGMYYDSAMIVMDEYYPNYDEISMQYKSLNNLVTNLITVQTQDSLQYLASLSAQELNQKISSWVETAKIQKEKEEEALVYAANVRSANKRTNRSTFYFYNASTVAYGKKEFQKKWGNRKLTDNWRRSNQSTQEPEPEQPTEDQQEESLADAVDQQKVEELRIDDPTNPKYYMQDIPVDEAMLATSNNMIRDGLYNAGMIFRADFNDTERSIECFLELNKRFPENIYSVSAYFNLYDLYKTTNQPDSANYYKSLIIDNYPETNFAKFLINPNYFIEQEVQKDSLIKIYHQSLVAYRNHNLPMAADLSAKALELAPDSTIKPKVEFINLISVYAQKPKEELITRLINFKEEYSNEPLNEIIDQIIKLANEKQLNNYQDLVKSGYLNDIIQNPELAEEINDTEIDSKWDTDEDLFHYFVIAIPNDESIDINRLKFDIANYNIDHYMTRDFEIETEKLNPETQLIIVRNLDDKESGLIYFLSIIRKPEVFKTLAAYQYLNFIISNNNFRQMKEDGSYDAYIQFFIHNYSNFTKGLFDESELETPEELIARLQKEDEIQEKGEFVIVETGAQTDNKKFTPIFNTNFADEHYVMLLINQANYRTAFINRGFMMFNNMNYRASRLRTATENLNDYTILNVSKFDNARIADDYIKSAKGNKNIFTTLNDINYSFISISKENYKLLLQNNEVENYLNFYNSNYNNLPEVIEKKKKVVTNTPQQPAATQTQENNQQLATNSQEEVNQPKKDEEEKKPEPEVTVYSEDKNVPHNIIFIIPAQGVNTALLTMYINRFKSISFSGLSIDVATKDFNAVKKTVIISGFANAEVAQEFNNGITNDKRITLALRAVEYKRFIISNSNLEKMKELDDLSGYQSFYDKNY